jgi:carboxyl-terminal processing protease
MPWTLATSPTLPPHPESALAKRIHELALSQSRARMNPAGTFGKTPEAMRVVFPSRLDGLPEKDAHQLRDLRQLFQQDRAALETELGARLLLDESPPGEAGATWLLGPAACTPELLRLGLGASTVPVLRRIRAQRLLVSDAPDAAGLFESLSLLRSFAWTSGDALEARPCDSTEQAFMRVAEEIAHTWPSFQRRGISWREVCIRRADAMSMSLQPLDTLRAMVAELEDAHTAVRRTDRIIPPSFRARFVDGRLLMHEVPEGSAAWHAGAREGFWLDGPDVTPAWQLNGATPHHRPFAVPFRLLSGAVEQSTDFSAVGPSGQVSRWTELYQAAPVDSVVSWRRMPSGAGYLRIERWPSSDRIDELIDEAFEDFRHAPGLIVDLRGNPGGSISVATRFRDRFLHQRAHLGSIQFTGPDGELLPPEELWAEPAKAQRRWPSRVRFLTDGETYSASEDALLGLQGLAHVEVLGMPSGGGSGRARSISLLPGWRLMVSTCLTFDRNRRCVEGSGIKVDRLIPMGRRTHGAWEAELLAAADTGW